jgi:peptidoglycan/xylan/chitin deacetylase (PgdA/CDA1 family)
VKAISIGYHDIIDAAQGLQGTAPPCVTLYTLDRQNFQNHLQSIQEYDPSIDRIERFRFWGQKVPVFLTFDDGRVSAYTCVADDLEKKGWHGHFFITTDWIGRSGFLDRRQIRELDNRGHVIGSHSCSHPERMSLLTTAELVKEWTYSCGLLSDILGKRVSVASVPNGYYSRKVSQSAATAGIEVLFTSEPTAVPVVEGCLILGRYCILRHMRPAVSGSIAAGCLWPRWRQTVLWEAKKTIKALTGESYLFAHHYLVSQVLNRATPLNAFRVALRTSGLRLRKKINF